MRAAIGLGASIGARLTALELAWSALGRLSDLGPPRASRVIQTPPVGGVARRSFFNAVVRIETSLGPVALLDALQALERRLGRRRARQDADRVVDLDLLLFGDEVHHDERLTVPHPRMGGRLFVLQPLAEVWPDAADPVTRRLWSSYLDKARHPVVGVLPASGRRCTPAASRSPS